MTVRHSQCISFVNIITTHALVEYLTIRRAPRWKLLIFVGATLNLVYLKRKGGEEGGGFKRASGGEFDCSFASRIIQLQVSCYRRGLIIGGYEGQPPPRAYAPAAPRATIVCPRMQFTGNCNPPKQCTPPSLLYRSFVRRRPYFRGRQLPSLKYINTGGRRGRTYCPSPDSNRIVQGILLIASKKEKNKTRARAPCNYTTILV
jgi:hypothetical protein